MKKYLTIPNIVIAILVLGVIFAPLVSKFMMWLNPPDPNPYIQETLPQVVQNWDNFYFESVSGMKQTEINRFLPKIQALAGSCTLGEVQGERVDTDVTTYSYVFPLTCEKGSFLGNAVIAWKGRKFKYLGIYAVPVQ